MGAGADVAIESADITLMRDHPEAVAGALLLSRQTIRTVKQNLFWAFFYNVLLIPVAAGALYPLFQALGGVPGGLAFFFGELGFLNPALAALAMACSSGNGSNQLPAPAPHPGVTPGTPKPQLRQAADCARRRRKRIIPMASITADDGGRL